MLGVASWTATDNTLGFAIGGVFGFISLWVVAFAVPGEGMGALVTFCAMLVCDSPRESSTYIWLAHNWASILSAYSTDDFERFDSLEPLRFKFIVLAQETGCPLMFSLGTIWILSEGHRQLLCWLLVMFGKFTDISKDIFAVFLLGAVIQDGGTRERSDDCLPGCQIEEQSELNNWQVWTALRD